MLSRVRTGHLRDRSAPGTLHSVSEPALDNELVMIGLGLLADVAANTSRIVDFLEGLDSEEENEH